MRDEQRLVSVAAVVVTHNRLGLLKRCVAAIRQQARPVDEIIVVNNASNDGTASWLAQQPGLTIIHQANLGGSGGQHSGILAAFDRGHDWFWCMDDDTLPAPAALGRLLASPYARQKETGFLNSLVTWVDGEPHRMNLPGLGHDGAWLATVLADRCVRIRSCSFVSLLVSRSAVAAVGLPIKDFYIWYDDVEYTRRISKRFNGYLVLDSVVVHDTAENAAAPVSLAPTAPLPKRMYQRYCFGVRNLVYLQRVGDESVPKRAANIGATFYRQARLILQRRVPPRAMLWATRGLFFRPRIDRPTSEGALGGQRKCESQ